LDEAGSIERMWEMSPELARVDRHPLDCTECGEPAELICVDCETPFCPEHLHLLGEHWASVVCGPCLDREMAAAW
jgi:hypothetical protein